MLKSLLLMSLVSICVSEDFSAKIDLLLKDKNGQIEQIEKETKIKIDRIKVTMVSDLEKAKKDALKNGNLEFAVAINDKIKELGKDNVINNSIKNKLVGKWNVKINDWKDTIIIDNNYNIKATNISGKLTSDNQIEIKWNNGYTWKNIRLDVINNTITADNINTNGLYDGQCIFTK